MILRDKNKRLPAGLFLAFYTFFILFAALHTHRGAVYTDLQINFISGVKPEKVTDPFLDQNSNCQLIQFSNTGTIVPDSFRAASLFINLNVKYRSYDSGHYQSEHLRNSDLRAPPFNS